MDPSSFYWHVFRSGSDVAANREETERKHAKHPRFLFFCFCFRGERMRRIFWKETSGRFLFRLFLSDGFGDVSIALETSMQTRLQEVLARNEGPQKKERDGSIPCYCWWIHLRFSCQRTSTFLVSFVRGPRGVHTFNVICRTTFFAASPATGAAMCCSSARTADGGASYVQRT